jgi:hypothetical protein
LDASTGSSSFWPGDFSGFRVAGFSALGCSTSLSGWPDAAFSMSFWKSSFLAPEASLPISDIKPVVS